jgi:hypothetical protein
MMSITLPPEGHGREVRYRRSWKLLGDMEMVPRARIELATPAFSGPRSTSELPRHRYSVQFYGNYAAVTNENREVLGWMSSRSGR